MKVVRNILADFLRRSQLEIKVTGFDMHAFADAIQAELSGRLDMVEYIAFEDSDIVSDSEKIKSIQELFRKDFYDKE